MTTNSDSQCKQRLDTIVTSQNMPRIEYCNGCIPSFSHTFQGSYGSKSPPKGRLYTISRHLRHCEHFDKAWTIQLHS